MFVLVACEESQRVCMAFRKKGHIAFSADLQPCSGGHPELHIQGDVLKILSPDPLYGVITFYTCTGHKYCIPGWDLLIAHPPCTFLTVAGACNIPNDPTRIEKGYVAADMFMTFLNAPIPMICVENPRPMARFGLPPKSQVIEPWYFYDEANEGFTKRTYLWLKNLPYLTPTNLWPPDDLMSWCLVHSSSKIRSKTFIGIAEAMASQWGSEENLCFGSF
ncbi:MAG: DNA cytosine methyltransferase [Clostridia bacterium]|nr:DNA cytosine methyltransferase [Clostridia bacterium]